MKKTEIRKGLGFGALVAACSALIVLLDRAVYNNFLIALSWGVSVELLLLATIVFIYNTQAKIRAIVFLCVGSVLFIVNAFVFIDKIITSVVLIITVALTIAGLILLCNALKQKAEIRLYKEKKDTMTQPVDNDEYPI